MCGRPTSVKSRKSTNSYKYCWVCRERLDLMRPTYDGDFSSGTTGIGAAEAKEDALFENLAAAQHASSRLMLANCLMPSRFVVLGPRTTSLPPLHTCAAIRDSLVFLLELIFLFFVSRQSPAITKVNHATIYVHSKSTSNFLGFAN